MAAALVVNIMAHDKIKFSRLVKSLPSYFTIKEKISCPNTIKEKVLETMINKTKGQKNDLIDGIKIWASDESWVLIRPSGTEPIFRIFVEAKNEKDALELAKKYKIIINQIIDEIK